MWDVSCAFAAEALPRRTASSYRPWRLGRDPPARRRAGQGRAIRPEALCCSPMRTHAPPAVRWGMCHARSGLRVRRRRCRGVRHLRIARGSLIGSRRPVSTRGRAIRPEALDCSPMRMHAPPAVRWRDVSCNNAYKSWACIRATSFIDGTSLPRSSLRVGYHCM